LISRLTSNAKIAGLIAFTVAARLIIAATTGLGIDESYAVSVARPFSASYFDHPPLLFWIAGSAQSLFGQSSLAVRLPFIALFAVTTWLIFRLTSVAFGETAGIFAAVTLNLAPVFSLTTGTWVLPDGPLMCALTASAYCVARAVWGGDQRKPLWWVAAGVAAGAGLLAKYHAVLFLAGLGVWLITVSSGRVALRTAWPWIALGIAVMGVVPVAIWNARHGWVSFAFQGSRAEWTHFSLAPFAENVAGQALWLLPWIWLPLVWVFARALVRGPSDDRGWFFACLAGIPIVLFTLATLGGRRGLPHWQAPGYLFAFPLLGRAMATWWTRAPRLFSRALASAAVVLIVVTSVAVLQVRTGWVASVAPSLFAKGDPTVDALDWTTLGDWSANAQNVEFVVAPSWIQGGKVGRGLRGRAPVVVLAPDPHHFLYAHDDRTFVGRSALIVAVDRGGESQLERYAPYFASIDSIPPFEISRNGRVATVLAARIGRGYRGGFPFAQPR